MKEKIKIFLADVVKEMKKVTWPTKDELKESTIIVVVTCIILAGFVYIIDQLLNNIMKGLF